MPTVDPVISILKGALSFIIVLPILVFVHELGHFWVARLFGMKVDALAVMIGGIRKTDLKPFLKQPMVKNQLVWFIGGISGLVLALGAIFSIQFLSILGLVALGVALPIWITLRLGALYHFRGNQALYNLFSTWAIGIGLYVFATKLQHIQIMPLLGLIGVFSLIAVLYIYYRPVLVKPEGSKMGFGQISVEKDGSVEPVDVRFRPLWHRTDKHGTEFSLLCIPLGGFAAIHEMQPREDGSETLAEGGFYSKSPFARFCSLFAGPVFSVLFGILILTFVLASSGIQEPSKAPVLGKMVPESPALQAGMRSGDKVVRINGANIDTYFDLVKIVRQSHHKVDGKEVAIPLKFEVLRQGESLTFEVTPKVDEKPTDVINDDFEATGEQLIQTKILAAPTLITKPVSFGSAFQVASMTPVRLVQGLAQTFSKPKDIANNIGGPAAIAEQITEASNQGLVEVVTFAGLLSISLGVMNLLPIVPFDGGQMLVAIAEMIQRKRLSTKVQSVVNTVGVFFVFALMLLVVTLDISRHAGK